MQSPVIFITYFLAFLELGRVAKAASSNERDVDIEHGALGGVHTHFRAAEYLPQSLSAPNAGYKGKRAQAVKAEAAQFVAVANRYTKETARQVIESFDVAAFVPPSSFICVGDAHDAVQAEKLEDIRFVGLLNSTLKLDAFLRQVYSNQQSPDSLRHGLSSAIHYDPGSRLNSSSADELVTLHVSLPPKLGTRSHADGEQSAVEAFKDIRHENGVVIAHADGRSASLSLEIQLLKLTSVVHTLMYKSWVHFVQLHMPLQTLNTYTVGISQGASSSPKGTPVWNAGFTGKGEIAGMGDTGVDTSNCYFSKPDNKVIYNDLADKVDSNGHGTHVAGTMVGNAGDQGNEQGAAKDARMSFVDLQEYEKGDDSGALELPSSDTQNLKEDYLDLLYRDGAKVSAHSFGACNSRLYCGYNKFSQDFDWFAWERQDALPVVAAGNEFSISRVLSPGNAKNALAVGATLSPRSSAESDEVVSLARKTGNNVLNLFLSLPPLPIISVVDVGKIAQMQSFSDAGLVDGSNFGIESIVINDSPQECVYRSDGLADKIVVGNGFCDGMSTLAKKAANASAKAYIHVPSASNWFELTSAPRTHFEETGLGNVGIPVGYAAYNPGRELLYSLIENMTSIIGSFQVRSFDTSRLWESFLAEYSSLGPVLNDAGALPRIKPDVVAPGDQIRSAKAGTECGTTSARGTSMATPSVAGAAVLARQYLRKQIGVSNPSGSLIAAVMINSAEPMVRFPGLQNRMFPIIFVPFPLCLNLHMQWINPDCCHGFDVPHAAWIRISSITE